MTDFSHRLVRWYQVHKRELPWREHRNPYAIWLSEVLLQQTRVEQGTPYFLRFVERFPTVEVLATAQLDDLLQVWQGLGYYARARNLHAAAKIVANEWDGQWKTEVADWRALPGVGPYTAGAIASIAFGTRAAAVDGNVYRVLSRWAGIETAVDQPEGQKALWGLAESLLPAGDCGDHTQALMELGSLVCSPKQPKCGECPIAADCAVAFQPDKAELLPVKLSKTKVLEEHWHRLFVVRDGQFLCGKRPITGIWPGLMDLPQPSDLGKAEVEIEAGSAGKPVEHRLSHRRLWIHFHHLDARELTFQTKGFEWVALDNWEDHAWPVPVGRWLKKNSTFDFDNSTYLLF